ncbi:cryptochrome/photolyase family protein [Desulfohalovibrio reitneri]|uniref:cryptochrome/photolyase family protein n=1 Tax=Desulfohalovibrio reitneri TaxID=1307759 RepID=UPI0004A73630|nr:cryptochrome/photolyase family protein [Desulfohalovibrio reitneri]
MKAALVLPHQLFDDHPALDGAEAVYLFEDPLFFSDSERSTRLHRQKPALHRASMLHYADRLRERGANPIHLRFEPKEPPDLWARLRADGVAELRLCDPVDHPLEKRLEDGAAEHGVRLAYLPSPGFLLDDATARELAGKEGQRHSQTSFYRQVRTRRGVLVDEAGHPEGGKWSFDPENRRKLPRDEPVPDIPAPPATQHLTDALAWAARAFPDNPGDLAGFRWPVTRQQARDCLDDFLDHRLARFGDFQDALEPDHPFLFHSLLSPALNTGLLPPAEVVERTLERGRDAPMNCLEGFLRQVMGWREYVRAMYRVEGENQRAANALGHHRPMPRAFYDGTTGLPPVDLAVAKLRRRAYTHHIERLMVLGNAMLLCEIDPGEVYRWFLELHIDGFDWVMVPNVYAMSQYADGGGMTTKPYCSSSNYLRKMGRYPRGEWETAWDGLYWRFVRRHRKLFESTPRLKAMPAALDRMDQGKLRDKLRAAENFLEEVWDG